MSLCVVVHCAAGAVHSSVASGLLLLVLSCTVVLHAAVIVGLSGPVDGCAGLSQGCYIVLVLIQNACMLVSDRFQLPVLCRWCVTGISVWPDTSKICSSNMPSTALPLTATACTTYNCKGCRMRGFIECLWWVWVHAALRRCTWSRAEHAHAETPAQWNDGNCYKKHQQAKPHQGRNTDRSIGIPKATKSS
jgi:hypothetical protein